MKTWAMYEDTEYPIWKRSFRSSPSVIGNFVSSKIGKVKST